MKQINKGQFRNRLGFTLGFFTIAAIVLQYAGSAALGAPVKISRSGKSTTNGPAALVRCDYELCDFLKKAQKHITKKEYPQAVKILQALIEKPDSGFAPRKDGNNQRFVSLRSEAVRLLGTIPPEHLEGYRRLYDSKARSKFKKALQTGNIPALKQVAEIYALTSVGPIAIERLGEMEFDRGGFTQSAAYWMQLLEITSGTEKPPLLLLKIAVASHLAGLDSQSKTFADKLRKNHPDATAVLGGRQQKLVEFLDAMLKIPAKSASTVPSLSNSYPGWGGIPNGLGTMNDCSVLMLPKWKYPAGQPKGKNIYNKLIPQFGLSSLDSSGYHGRGDSNDMRAELIGGNILLGFGKKRVSRKKSIILPAILKPVLVDDAIIYRDDNRVVALDIFTGELQWKSPKLPMEATIEGDSNNYYYYGGNFTETGRYALTAGGGKVFTIYGFAPQVFSHNRGQKIENSSSLAAVSTKAQGKLLWQIGRGGPKGNELAGFTFVSLPRYVAAGKNNDEKLYTVAANSEAFYLIALNANTGKVIWKTVISQIPVNSGGHFRGPWGRGGQQTFAGTPPVYHDNQVLVATNAGIIAAVDAATGQPVWAYQYEKKSPNIRRHGGRNRSTSIHSQLNPLIVTHGQVIALPADHSDVISLSVIDGSPIWKAPSVGMSQLTAIDAGRICLSGKKLKILNAKDGKELFKSDTIKSPAAHPLVTPTQIITCGEGTLTSVSLKDYSTAVMGTVEGDGLLGTLISTGQTLIAANASGVCGYFGFDSGFAELSKRMKNATPLEQIKLLMQRASLCDSAKMHDKALGNLLEAQKLIATIPDEEPKEKLDAKLLRRLMNAYISNANRAAGPNAVEEMLENFKTAEKFAATPEEKATMQLRIAKYYEWIGNLEKSIDAANLLIKNYPTVKVADVPIGQKGVGFRAASGISKTGEQMGNAFIERLLQIHGQEIYTTFNEQAKKAMDAAAAEKDIAALEAVKTSFPHSKWGNESIFLAAEIAYRANNIPKSTSLLCVLAGQNDNSHRVSAGVALVAIYTQQKWTQAAELTRGELENIPADTPVKFANISGTLGEVLKQIDGGNVTRPTTNPTTKPADTTGVIPPSIYTPLKPIFTLKGKNAFILTDTDDKAIEIGTNILIQSGDQTILFNPTAGDSKSAVVKKISTPATIGQRHIRETRFYAPQFLARKTGGPDDPRQCSVGYTNKILLTSHEDIVLFNGATGKVIWTKTAKEFGLKEFRALQSNYRLFVTANAGELIAVKSADGKIAWKASLGIRISKITMRAGFVMVTGASRSGRTRKVFTKVFNGKNGKLVYKHEQDHNSAAYHEISKQGYLFCNSGEGKLEVRDLSKKGAPVICETTFKPKTQAFGIRLTKHDLEIYPQSRRQGGCPNNFTVLLAVPKFRTFEIPVKQDSGVATPTKVLFDGKHYFSLNYTMPSNHGDKLKVTICKFSPKKTKPIIQAVLLPEKPLAKQERIRSCFMSKDRIFVIARNYNVKNASNCYVIDKSTCKVLQKIPVFPAKQKLNKEENRRRRLIGKAVWANGRLLIETPEGITVYGN
ncbi:MAG: PQQ-binding-like beta-propeller repeat protein [Phycisphaerae bacterium]|nr:PQQ-binding-like beta-propeller repeat protein [Phycisphaerae bacterium]